MENLEKIWQNLWRKKKKKGEGEEEDKENREVHKNVRGGDKTETVVLKEIHKVQTTIKDSEPSQKQGQSPALGQYRHNPMGGLSGRDHNTMAVAGLTGRDPYDRHKWVSQQHFHVPGGVQDRPSLPGTYRPSSRGPHPSGQDMSGRSSSRGPHPSGGGHDTSGRSSSRGGPLASSSHHNIARASSHHNINNITSHVVNDGYNSLKKPVEPYDKYKESKKVHVQHFHLPSSERRGRMMVYGRPGHRTAMTVMVDQLQSQSQSRARSPSMNNEEPIQLAHYPGGTPAVRDGEDLEEFPASSSSDMERKRRWSGSGKEEAEEDIEDVEEDLREEEKMRRNEEELLKISSHSGIGKVFLDTIQKREKIKTARLANIDPRSAARTPAANKEPPSSLRYNDPVYASPSRDTQHSRPWMNPDFDDQSVILSSSGCASGCTSDHFHPSTTPCRGVHNYGGGVHNSTTLPRDYTIHTLPREYANARSGGSIKPGYTQAKATTLPHIRSVSGRIVDDQLELRADGDLEDDLEAEQQSNPHNSILYTANNNFSWLTLAKYQTEDTLKKEVRTKYFNKPELKHKFSTVK